MKIIDMVVEDITNKFTFHKHAYHGMGLGSNTGRNIGLSAGYSWGSCRISTKTGTPPHRKKPFAVETKMYESIVISSLGRILQRIAAFPRQLYMRDTKTVSVSLDGGLKS